MVKSLVSLRDALTTAIDRLTAARVPSPRMNAELLLRFTLDCDRAYLYAHPERELTTEEQTRYEEALAQRARGIPAQYITGHQEFWGMDFIVNPAVLIPRPETEHVIETVLQLVNGGRASSPGMRIVDVGTGSGCIALALAKELPEAEVHATDISPAALEVARANAARHQLENGNQRHDRTRGKAPARAMECRSGHQRPARHSACRIRPTRQHVGTAAPSTSLRAGPCCLAERSSAAARSFPSRAGLIYTGAVLG